MADDWCTINWQKIEYLTTCGLRPWYLDNTTLAAASSQPPLQPPLHPKPHPNLSSDPTQKLDPTQQQPAGQQQAWEVPQQHAQQPQPQPSPASGQQWQSASGGGGPSDGAFQAVVAVGQPWEAGPGKWQCDVNVTIKNTGQQFKIQLLRLPPYCLVSASMVGLEMCSNSHQGYCWCIDNTENQMVFGQGTEAITCQLQAPRVYQNPV